MSNNSFIVWVASPSMLVREAFHRLLHQKGRRFVLLDSGGPLIPFDAILEAQTNLLIVDMGYFTDFEWMHLPPIWNSMASRLILCGFTKTISTSSPHVLFKHMISLYDSFDQIGNQLEAIYQLSQQEEETNTQEELSEREKEVLVELVKGLTNKEIGEQLHLSVHTVISHRKNITRKLDIKSTSGLTIYAIMNQLVSMEEINKS